MSTNLLTLLPELVLTVTGILVMLAEPVIAPGRSRKPLGWLAIFGSALSAGAAYVQLRYVNQHGPVLGFYNSIQVDAFSVFFHLLIAATILVTLLGSLDYFEAPVTHAGEYFALVLFGATGMMFMTCSVELLMVFVGLEISSISTYILAGFRKGQASASESSLKYFLLGSFATAFFLYGIALFFGATGSTSIAAIAGSITAASPSLALLALAMMLVGIGFKVSAAPFQVWTPDVYQGAPAPVVGLMSTAPKAAVFAFLLRLLFNASPSLRDHWSVLIWILAALSMTVGNLAALRQRDVKRMLAYSSIAHAGYILCAYVAFPQEATSAVCFYTAAYAAMNVGAFLVIAQMTGFGEGARTLDDFTGMAARRPVLSALLGLFLLSQIGIPFTGGFFGKFYVFVGAIHAGYIWLAVIGLANAGVACFYYLRLLAALYGTPFNKGDIPAVPPPARVFSPAVGAALAATAVATLALGILPGRVLHLAQRASVQSGITTAAAK